MKKLIIISLFALSAIVPVAHADVIDDNVVKAERSVQNALKRLEKAKQCQAQRAECLAEMQEKAAASVERAQKKLEALTASVAE